MNIIEAKDLTKIYKLKGEEIKALDKVNLSIEEGDFVCVLGRSGSGKSTFLNLLGALDTPTNGEVVIEGKSLRDISKNSLHQVRRNKIGFIFQEFNLIPTLTALENVELALKYAGVASKQRKEKARKLLDEVGLGDRLNHKPDELSGGQKQRVAIARALVNNPSIVLADEPTGEVDSATAQELVKLMKRLNQEFDQTFIVVTHDTLVTEHATRIITLKDGRIEKDMRA